MRRGVELPEASAATLIRARYLEALENERFEVLPEGPYLRSFLREYAEFLGLDGDLLVTEWMLRYAPVESPILTAPRRRRGAAFLDGLPGRRGWLVALSLVALGAVLWWVGGSSHTTVQSSPPVREQSAPPPPATSTSSVPPVRKTRPSLALVAVRGPSWLLVRIGSPTGRVVAEATLQRGHTIRFGLRKPLWIRVGAPWNLSASIGRRALTASLPTDTGNVLVTARGVRPA